MLKKWGKEKQFWGIQSNVAVVSFLSSGWAGILVFRIKSFYLVGNNYLKASFMLQLSLGTPIAKISLNMKLGKPETELINHSSCLPGLPKEHSLVSVLCIALCEINGMWWALNSVSRESLYLCCTGVVYKLWLLRNVLKCQMLVFCGLDEANAENKQIKKKKKIVLILGSQNLFSSSWHWKHFLAGGWAFFGVFLLPWVTQVAKQWGVCWPELWSQIRSGNRISAACFAAKNGCTKGRRLCGFVSNLETTSKIFMAL